MNTLKNKLFSTAAASLSVALLFFLACAVVGSVILASATAAAGRAASLKQDNSERYQVIAAARHLASDMDGLTVSYAQSRTTTRTVKNEYEDSTQDEVKVTAYGAPYFLAESSAMKIPSIKGNKSNLSTNGEYVIPATNYSLVQELVADQTVLTSNDDSELRKLAGTFKQIQSANESDIDTVGTWKNTGSNNDYNTMKNIWYRYSTDDMKGSLDSENLVADDVVTSEKEFVVASKVNGVEKNTYARARMFGDGTIKITLAANEDAFDDDAEGDHYTMTVTSKVSITSVTNKIDSNAKPADSTGVETYEDLDKKVVTMTWEKGIVSGKESSDDN